MPHPLTQIRKNGVYTLLTPEEDGFLTGVSEGAPVVFFFSMKKKATAFRAALAKEDHVITKEEALPLIEELIELGITQAFVDPEGSDRLGEPLLLPTYLEHLKKEAQAAVL